jgi:hypothetical protein
MEALALRHELGEWDVVRRDSKFARNITTGRDAISMCVFHINPPNEEREEKAQNCAPVDLWKELRQKLEARKGLDWKITSKGAVVVNADTWGNLRVSCKTIARPAELEIIFNGLVKRWQDATGGYSVTRRRYAHQSYQAILVLKDDVVPLILKELQRRPDWWFEALEVLTQQNPVPLNASFEEAVNSWIDWGKRTNRLA